MENKQVLNLFNEVIIIYNELSFSGWRFSEQNATIMCQMLALASSNATMPEVGQRNQFVQVDFSFLFYSTLNTLYYQTKSLIKAVLDGMVLNPSGLQQSWV